MTPITTDRLSRPAYDALPAETRAELEAAVPAGMRVRVTIFHQPFAFSDHNAVLRRGSRIIAVSVQPTVLAAIRRVLAVAGVGV